MKHPIQTNGPMSTLVIIQQRMVPGGQSIQVFLKSQRWITRPEFLWETQDQWPVRSCDMQLKDGDPEVKKHVIVNAVSTNDSEKLINELFKRYSSWYKLKRAVSWILKIKKRCRNEQDNFSTGITVQDLQEAEHAII
ncbi:uncharacterized protein LOC102805533 [Saccoglossus kowalevskii]|uniref:Uncharacterized protein LOC102805533 n=1 Tax=Saccoglossus kowalevskii TaxID=10224 RepID=A0ABM0M482_SACKO|nr:PREDICTED: uncharacterized protein LOC102807476 [Saccoglossus kowalevskii]XP_006825700.1 PREDICTED: uncharacterized protein LOC102805533 [Saccoglossus kowalevskii]